MSIETKTRSESEVVAWTRGLVTQNKCRLPHQAR